MNSGVNNGSRLMNSGYDGDKNEALKSRGGYGDGVLNSLDGVMTSRRDNENGAVNFRDELQNVWALECSSHDLPHQPLKYHLWPLDGAKLI